MKLNKLAIASAMAVASVGSFAAPGDVVFTDTFGGSFNSVGSGSVEAMLGNLAAGVYSFEAAVTGTGNITISNVMFNSTPVPSLTVKSAYGEGSFAGGDMKITFDWTSSSKPGGSYGGALTVTQAIPEPETYALMLAGLGAIGFMASRRRKG